MSLSLSLLMFAAGVGIPIMAAMNASVGVRLSSPLLAVFLLSAVATFAAGTVLLVRGFPMTAAVLSVPIAYFGAGLLFLFYILSITIAAPRIGIGNAVFFALLGQLVVAALIDHLGSFDTPVVPVDSRRVAGLMIIAIGVYLARRPPL